MICAFPPALKEKGTIGIVAPSKAIKKPERLQAAQKFLETQGYQVVVHAQNYLKDGWFAGGDAARAEAIMDMFADTTIDAILCARGGTGASHLVDLLDYELIRKNPKPFIGFSDATVLLHAISRRAGLVTFHGPMVGGFDGERNRDPRTVADFFHVVGAGDSNVDLPFAEVEGVRCGEVEGILLGGNMTLLQHMIGTSLDWFGKDRILFLEDVDEPSYKLERMLRHFALAGKFEGVRAVIVGQIAGLAEADAGAGGGEPFGMSLREIFMEHLPPEIPLVFDFPCGHTDYITSLPLGASVRLKIAPHTAELSFSKTV